jgi:hypothetical protein
MKIDLIRPGLKVQFVPEKPVLDACREFGLAVGRAVSGAASPPA